MKKWGVVASVRAVCCIIAIIITIAMVVTKGDNVTVITQRQYTVNDAKQKLCRELNEELKKPECPLRKWIENAHGTVFVKYAHVLTCDMTTIDGSENAGKDDGNIRSAVVDIKFVWDGIFHKGGYSVLRLDIDAQNPANLTGKIIKTDALINLEDPKFLIDCAKVGFQIGVVAAELFSD